MFQLLPMSQKVLIKKKQILQNEENSHFLLERWIIEERK